MEYYAGYGYNIMALILPGINIKAGWSRLSRLVRVDYHGGWGWDTMNSLDGLSQLVW